MREANWDEIFQRRQDDGPAVDDRIAAFLPWEEWLTLLIAAVCFLSVVHSIDSAQWVDGMPSLYPIGFAGLMVGYVLSRVKAHALLLHPAGLLAGAALAYLQLIAIVPGGSVSERTDNLVDRMHVWWSAATQGGISDDPLPFIVLTVVLVWLGAYASSWAIFRWRNAWLGLTPGGLALMWNISFIPGQFSYSFVVFVFAAVLLLMRVHVANREAEWQRRSVVYPEFLSLSVLHATFWAALLLLLLARAMPLAAESDSASERWDRFTSPLTDRLAPLSRVFVSVNAKKPIKVHNLEDVLAFQGEISPSDRPALEVDVEISPEVAAFLRAQSFDEYTSSGWKLNIEDRASLDAGERTNAADDDIADARRSVTATIRVQGDHGDLLYSLGQPVQSSESAEAATGGAASDVNRLKPSSGLDDGDEYSVTGSVNVASVDQLRAAGTDYPDWITDRYLQLPRKLPDRVEQRARDVAGGAATPYDQAAAIERYLRTFPQDFDVPSTPHGRDTIDYFLFDLQRGYFDYHASAMAVMLRTLGVPARVATGYALDPAYRDLNSTTYRLTEMTAFAWPEVYFPGIGWVEFSPAPSQPAIHRPGLSNDTNGEPGDFIDPNTRPDEPPIDLDIDEPTGPAAEPVAAADGGGTNGWRAFAWLVAIGAALAMFAGGARYAWEFGLGGLSRPQQLWEKTARLARWARTGARPGETPRAFAARLRRDVPGADAAGYVAAVYERSRFGHQDALADDEAEQLETAWGSLRNALLRRLLRR